MTERYGVAPQRGLYHNNRGTALQRLNQPAEAFARVSTPRSALTQTRKRARQPRAGVTDTWPPHRCARSL